MATRLVLGAKVFAMHCVAFASLIATSALALAPPCSAQVLAVASGGFRLAGTVRDSIRSGPLADARVELVPAAARESAGYRAVTDSLGAFSFDSVAPGRYLIGFFHARLDSLGIAPTTRIIDVGDDAVQRVITLAVPSARSVAAALCGAPNENTGVMFGRLLAADDASPVKQATVHARWGELVVDAGRLKREIRTVRFEVGETGRYVLCGLPTNVTVLVSVGDADDVERPAERTGIVDTTRTSVPSAWSGTLELSVDSATMTTYRDILVTTEARASASLGTQLLDSPADAPVAPTRTTRTAALIGRIVRPDGSPLRGARVRIRAARDADASGDREATTGDDGRYALDGLPGGTQPVEVIALGFSPIRGIVDLRPRRAATFNATVATFATVLDAVTVYAALPIRAGHEFAIRRADDRRTTFVTADDIARRTPVSTSFALAGVNGLRVVPGEGGRLKLSGRLGPLGSPQFGGSVCSLRVFIDGFPLENVGDIDNVIRPNELGGVEVYDDAYSAPPKYGGGGSPCQVVLLWSKAALR